MKQSCRAGSTTDDAIIRGLRALVDNDLALLLLLHSQGGAFGFKGRRAAPGQVKAIARSSPRTAGNVGNGGGVEEYPTLMRSATRSISIRAGRRSEDRFELCRRRASGRRRRRRDQPADIGIKGNSHMLMAGQEQRRDRRAIQSGWSERVSR